MEGERGRKVGWGARFEAGSPPWAYATIPDLTLRSEGRPAVSEAWQIPSQHSHSHATTSDFLEKNKEYRKIKVMCTKSTFLC